MEIDYNYAQDRFYMNGKNITLGFQAYVDYHPLFVYSEVMNLTIEFRNQTTMPEHYSLYNLRPQFLEEQ